MEKSKIIQRSLLNSLGAAIYIAVVAVFMSNVEKFFGNKPDTFLAPLSMLLLFVLSAAVVSGLILGKPIILYLDGEKKVGVELFLYSLAWLFIFTILAFIAVSRF